MSSLQRLTVLLVALAAGGGALAQVPEATWQATRSPGGAPVARMVLRDTPIASMELACAGSQVALGVQPARASTASTFSMVFQGDDGAMVSVSLPRLGASGRYAGVVTDSRLALGLAGAWSSGKIGVSGGAIPLQVAASAAVVRNALAACMPSAQPPGRPASTPLGGQAPAPDADGDIEQIKADVGRIYGYRDGRKITTADTDPKFSPVIRKLLEDCERAVQSAGAARDGSTSYDIVGDQGCGGVPLLVDIVTGDPAPFISTMRPVVRKTPGGLLEATITTPPRHQEEWGKGQTIIYRKIGQQWLIDDIRHLEDGSLYSATIRQQTAEINALPRKRVTRP